MRFTSKEDINLPAEAVFRALTDFAEFERAALRRGADVRRSDSADGSPLGTEWTIRFRHRGRERELTTRIARHDPPAALASDGRIGGVEGRLAFDLVALSPQQTRLSADLELKPRTLGARLLLQSMRLAKSNLTARFKSRLRRFARELELRGGGLRRG